VAGVLSDMIRELPALISGLRELDITVTAEELCDAVWLAAQDWDDFPHASAAVPGQLADPGPQVDAESQHGRRIQARSLPSRELSAQVLAPGLPADTTGAARPYLPVSLPDVPALPQARELAAVLRPLRYDPRYTYPGDGIDEEATAVGIARSGIRRPAWQTTRRRRLDLDLVFDIGGSGPLWTRLASELRTMLESVGAFRSLRFWMLNTDHVDAPLLPVAAMFEPRRQLSATPYEAVCPAPRRPVVVVLTDGTGHAWQTGKATEPLRDWAASGTVLAVQLLPPRLWNRTALRPLPMAIRPSRDGHHSGSRIVVNDAQLSIAGLRRSELPGATAVPVIGLEARWLRSWLKLTRADGGAVPGYAALIPAPRKAKDAAGDGQEESLVPEPSPEQRYEQFMLTASVDARRLARLCAVTTLTVPGMRKIRHELLPESRPEILAEVLLSGLVRWPPVTPAEALAGLLQVEFQPFIQDLLRERLGGVGELVRDAKLVGAVLQARSGGSWSHPLIEVGAGSPGEFASVPQSAPPLLEPYPAPAAAITASSAKIVAASERDDDESVHEDADARSTGARRLRIGIWGSTASGRTTYLTVLGMLGMAEWTHWRRGEQWRVMPQGAEARQFLTSRIDDLKQYGRFPEATLANQPEWLSFRLERRKRGPFSWLTAERMATVSLAFGDMAAQDFSSASDAAARYLAGSHVLAYFYDPVFDSYDGAAAGTHSADFFNPMAAMIATLSKRRLYQGYPPHHLAVCIAKLDEQVVFDLARRYGCLQTDRTGLPWVPPRYARRLFDAVTFAQQSIASYQLRETLSHSFHPKRTSFHALSSVGFWVGDGGFDPQDVCNVTAPPPDQDDATGRRVLRGTVRPVHVLDPLITLVERYARQAGGL
jgi:hypothetical protein